MAYYKCGRVYTTQNSNVVVDTASGAVANFNTSLALPLKSLKADVNAVQDLHGYNYPWIGGAGKNQFKITATSQTINGVTFTINDNGTVTINGTATGRNARLDLGLYTLKANTSVIINGLPDSVTTNEDVILGYQGYGTVNVRTRELSITRSSESDWENSVYIGVYEGKSVNNLTFSPMIRFSSVTDATFAPYENICPIEGWNEISLVNCGKNLFNGTNVINAYLSGAGLVKKANQTRLVYALCRPNTTYTVSKQAGSRFSVAYCDDVPTNNLQTRGMEISSTASSITITTDSTARYIVSYVYHNDYDSITAEQMLATVQIEAGSSATAYEPYNGTTTPYLLPQTVYGGEIVKSKTGSVLRITGTKIVVTEQSNIQFAENENGFLFYVGTGKILLNNDAQFTNMGLQKAISASTLYWVENAFVVYPNGPAYFKFNNSINTVALAQSFLTNNPLEIYADYATPIEIPLSDLPEIVTKQGTNNIWVDSGDTSLQFRKIG